MLTNATKIRRPAGMAACRAVSRAGTGALSSEELEGLSSWIDGVRAEFGLPPKEGELSSNLILRNKWEELSHILRVEFDDMFNELSEASASTRPTEPVPAFRPASPAGLVRA